MACVASCRVSALSVYEGEDGHAYVRLDSSKCVGCLSCERVCNETRSLRGINDLDTSAPYAAWANSAEIRKNATSGGIATAAGKWCIDRGGCMIGSSFDGRRATHVTVSDVDGLKQLQGSKYVWSNPAPAYREIASHLSSGKVLFVGTGCQVAGVLAFFAGHPFSSNLYTIDLICGGVPSDLLMQSFFNSAAQLTSITSFRSKREYVLKGIVDGQEVVLPYDSLPLSGFRAEQTMRYSCYDCPFAFAHRRSDITIGDLWGDSAPADQRDSGVSLVVVHSEKGQEILSQAEVSSLAMKWKDVLPNNRRLVFGKTPRTWLRERLADNYKEMDASTFTRVYSVSSSISRPCGFATRLWLHLLRKLYSLRCRITIRSILNK